MPKPKQRSKPSKLPPGSGIREIALPMPGETLSKEMAETTAEMERVLDDHVIHASDRILLQQLKGALEDRHGRPYSTSEVLRWALWHCPWDT